MEDGEGENGKEKIIKTELRRRKTGMEDGEEEGEGEGEDKEEAEDKCPDSDP